MLMTFYQKRMDKLELFLEVFKQMKIYLNSTKDKPILPLCESPENYISMAAIYNSHRLPHKLEPLVIGVFG